MLNKYVIITISTNHLFSGHFNGKYHSIHEDQSVLAGKTMEKYISIKIILLMLIRIMYWCVSIQ